MLLVALAVLALVVGVALLALRNDEELTANWARLMQPSHWLLRHTLDAQLKAEKTLEALRRARERKATREGRVLGAAGLELEPGDPARRRALSAIRRMLSAR